MTPSERERRIEAAARMIYAQRWDDSVAFGNRPEWMRRQCTEEAERILDAADDAVPMVSGSSVKFWGKSAGEWAGIVGQKAASEDRLLERAERAEAAARDMAKEAFRGGYERGVSSGSLAPRDFGGLEHHWRTWCHEAGFASFSGEEGTDGMSLTGLEKRLCEPGATAVHLNSGETWTVAEKLNGGHLIVRSLRLTERKVSIEYWLSGAWADR